MSGLGLDLGMRVRGGKVGARARVRARVRVRVGDVVEGLGRLLPAFRGFGMPPSYPPTQP